VTATDGSALLESAAEFGLTRDQILETVATALDRLSDETKGRCIDELAAALATRLIEKERDTEPGVDQSRQGRPIQ
jgi:hypothetical protein